MPLDSHSYLVSQGWGGTGTGLRQGAISRPLAIPQKKTLAGLGKDRDEAFPFWDHLFSAASKSIQIKCLSDEEENVNSMNSSSNNNISIKCTSTGILSNRRPIDGTPATSGTNTPETTTPRSQSHNRLGLLATAKRDAAKRGLYSKFFRGPVLGPDTIIEEERRLAALVSQAFSVNDSIAGSAPVQETIDIQTVGENVHIDLEVSKSLKRKSRVSGTSDEEAKRERKRRRKEKKEKEKKAEKHETEKRHKKDKPKDTEVTLRKSSPPPISQKTQKVEGINVIDKNTVSGNVTDDQADPKWRKEEEKKRLKKLEKTQVKDMEETHSNHGSKSLETQTEEIYSANAPDKPKKRRKKRKHADAE